MSTTIRPFHPLIAESGDPSNATTVYPFGALWDRDAAGGSTIEETITLTANAADTHAPQATANASVSLGFNAADAYAAIAQADAALTLAAELAQAQATIEAIEESVSLGVSAGDDHAAAATAEASATLAAELSQAQAGKLIVDASLTLTTFLSDALAAVATAEGAASLDVELAESLVADATADASIAEQLVATIGLVGAVQLVDFTTPASRTITRLKQDRTVTRLAQDRTIKRLPSKRQLNVSTGEWEALPTLDLAWSANFANYDDGGLGAGPLWKWRLSAGASDPETIIYVDSGELVIDNYAITQVIAAVPTAFTFPADYRLKHVKADAGEGHALVCRLQDSGACYALVDQSDQLLLLRLDEDGSGITDVSLGTVTGLTIGVGDEIELRCVGETISAWLNGVQQLSAVDTNYATGSGGYGIQGRWGRLNPQRSASFEMAEVGS